MGREKGEGEKGRREKGKKGEGKKGEGKKGEGRTSQLTKETSTGDDELQLLRREGTQYVFICFGNANLCAKSEPVHVFAALYI